MAPTAVGLVEEFPKEIAGDGVHLVAWVVETLGISQKGLGASSIPNQSAWTASRP
jgi:hypothetical protein